MSQLLKRYQSLEPSFPENMECSLRKSFRVNTKKISCEKLIARLTKKGVRIEKIPFTQTGYYYESPFSLAATEEYLMGYLYIQEAASQLPAEVLLADLGNNTITLSKTPSQTEQNRQSSPA